MHSSAGKKSAVPPLNPYPLAHGNFSCEFDTPVAPRRVDRKEEPGLLEGTAIRSRAIRLLFGCADFFIAMPEILSYGLYPIMLFS